MSIISINKSALDKLINESKRVGIIGYPGAGKTTLSNKYSNKLIIHTDDFLHLSHDERPEAILKILKEPFIVEGNEVTRLITRGLDLDCLVLVTGSARNDKSLRGLQGRIDKFLNESLGTIYTTNPRF